ncbi:MAG: (2Fe-2S)-binding protein, partial [Pirellulales bacterium]|nr:(2Fe-2S)-binding protein [Pirellulales bacterium]
ENGGARSFDIGAHADISRADYDALMPFQWPAKRGAADQNERFFADGGYQTSDGRASFLAIQSSEIADPLTDFPMTLNTGRVRDHWHTMTRTGKSARLSAHLAEPYAEISRTDALRLGIRDADLVRVESSLGEIIARAYLSPRQAEHSVFVPMHWSDRYASNARVDRLVLPVLDPSSGQPASKKVPVRLKRFDAAWYGFAVLRDRPDDGAADYWALARCAEGWRIELAGDETVDDWTSYARALFGLGDETDLLAYRDERSGQCRLAAWDGDRLVGALFVGPRPVAVSRAWAAGQLGVAVETAPERLRILAGRAGADLPDPGATVCSCHSVGINQITDALASGRCRSLDEIGAQLKAGTNCGSCRAEIQAIIAA